MVGERDYEQEMETRHRACKVRARGGGGLSMMGMHACMAVHRVYPLPDLNGPAMRSDVM
jgi:hypothetical protein